MLIQRKYFIDLSADPVDRTMWGWGLTESFCLYDMIPILQPVDESAKKSNLACEANLRQDADVSSFLMSDDAPPSFFGRYRTKPLGPC